MTPPGRRFALQTVLFDLDGTLADTAPDLAAALNAVRREAGLEPLPFEAIRPAVSHGTAALIRRGLNLAPEDEGFEAARDALIEHYRADIATRTRLFPGMERVLEQLEARGLPWGVVTNKPAHLTEPLMEALGLSERAGCIVSGDSAARPKPDPAPMYLACEKIGCDSEAALYVGDARRDIEAGRNAGMKTVAALFGYLGPDDEPDRWGADATIEHPEQLLDWIE